MNYSPRLTCLLAATFVASCTAQSAGEAEPPWLSEADTARRTTSASPDGSLLGFRLNEPLNLPPCKGEPEAREQTCLEKSDSAFIPLAERPRFLTGSTVEIHVDDAGLLQSITVRSESLSSPMGGSLYEKLGPPDYLIFNPHSVQQIREWTFSDMHVQWVTWGDDYSWVTARTRAKKEREDAESEAKEARKRRL